MGVTVTERRGARKASSTEGRGDADREFLVVYDTVEEADPVLALTADDGSTEIPDDNEAHPQDGTLRVTKKDAKVTDEVEAAFIVSVHYEQKDNENEENTGGGETDTELPTIQGRSVQRSKAITHDVNGNAIVNSAGDPFDPPPEIETSTGVITVRGSVAFDAGHPIAIDVYRDTIDNGGMFGYPAFALKLSETGWQTRRVSKTQVKLDIELTWYIDDWTLSLVDNGVFQVDEPGATQVSNTGPTGQTGTVTIPSVLTTTRKRILDSEGKPVGKPVLLDGNGQPLGNGAPVLRGPFQVYLARPHDALLNLLGLPTTLTGYTQIPS